jgi:hypothetical protein
MLYLFSRGLQTARRLQSWSAQHTYDTRHYIQDKIRQYNRLSHTHSLIIVSTNYIVNSNLKYLQSIESIEIYCYFQWIHIHTEI